MTYKTDRNRDRVFLGDLSNLARLKDLERPSQDEIRLYASIVRRLLLDGLLPSVAGSRKMPLNFLAPDVKPLLSAARGDPNSFFILGGIDLFGVKKLEGIMVEGTSVSVRSDGTGLNRIPIKLDGFLSQVTGYVNKKTITRRDVISYISNKAGGVHYDMKPTNALPAEKLATIGQLRSRLGLSIDQGKVVVHVFLDTLDGKFVEGQIRDFCYEPAYIDAIFLEFLSTAHFILESPDVKALQVAVMHDIIE
jgi:hypothetical protein